MAGCPHQGKILKIRLTEQWDGATKCWAKWPWSGLCRVTSQGDEALQPKSWMVQGLAFDVQVENGNVISAKVGNVELIEVWSAESAVGRLTKQ